MEQTLILIVDDEPYVTTVVGQQLQRRGYDVLTASDGQEALPLAKARRPGLIITDFQMPLLGGVEMALQLRQDPITHDIPLIMLTARGHRVPATVMEQTNIRWLLSKPFSIKELMERVGQALESKTAGAETSTLAGKVA